MGTEIVVAEAEVDHCRGKDEGSSWSHSAYPCFEVQKTTQR